MPDDQYDDSTLDLRALETDLVSPVMRRIATLPAHDTSRIGPLWGLWSMSRSLTLAAAVTTLIVLALGRPWQSQTPRPPDTVAQSLGVPPEFQDLIARRGER